MYTLATAPPPPGNYNSILWGARHAAKGPTTTQLDDHDHDGSYDGDEGNTSPQPPLSPRSFNV